MGFAVFHISKGSGSGGGTGHHIDRTPGHEHTFQHTDPSRQTLNKSRAFENGAHLVSLPNAINQRIEEGYQGKKAIRKDAVKYLSLVLTGSHEDMTKLATDPVRFKAWQQANFDFVAQEFGKANILRFTLHMDEKTPHIHAVVVPLTKDGRLSAKELMGNKKSLSLQQDRYAEAMEPFELSRGVRDSKARHTGEGWYLEHLKEARESQNKATVPQFGFMDIARPKKYLESVKTSLNAFQQENTDLQLENQRRANQIKDVQAKQQQTEKIAANEKEAVQAIAEQLIKSGKEGITLNASYALQKAPLAIRRAANRVFAKEVQEFARISLKPYSEVFVRATLRIEKEAKPTQQDYERLQQIDTPQHRQKVADRTTDLFKLQVYERWGIALLTTGTLYQEIAQKALKAVNEATTNLAKEIQKALGLDEPQKQNRSRGMRR